MQEKHLFEYAVIRLIPRVDREEFLNVGVILYCQPHNFLRTDYELNSERLSAFSAELNLDDIAEHLSALKQICRGGEDGGAIGRLPIGERFRWLTAPRSTVVQTSAVHTGLCLDPAQKLEDLMSKLVR